MGERLNETMRQLQMKGEEGQRIKEAHARKFASQMIQNTKPLSGGVCDVCCVHAERLVPQAYGGCRRCALKIVNKGSGNQRVFLQKKYHFGTVIETIKEWRCDICLEVSGVEYLVNPRTCESCFNRIAKRHKFQDYKKRGR